MLTLPGKIRCGLERRAAVYGMSQSDFLAVLIETIDRDDLYGAVLDDGR